MKNKFLLFAVGLLLVSCQSNNSPENAVRNVVNALIQGDCEAFQAGCSEEQGEDIQEWCSDESDYGRDVERAKETWGDRFDWEVSSASASLKFTSPDGSDSETLNVILENGIWKMDFN